MADFQARVNRYLVNLGDAPDGAVAVDGRSKAAGAPSSAGWSPAVIKCSTCEQTVYPMEKILIDGRSYHKPCFKCSLCNNVLGVGNYASYEGKAFCEPHYKQLFALKGNFQEVVSAEPPKSRRGSESRFATGPPSRSGSESGMTSTTGQQAKTDNLNTTAAGALAAKLEDLALKSSASVSERDEPDRQHSPPSASPSTGPPPAEDHSSPTRYSDENPLVSEGLSSDTSAPSVLPRLPADATAPGEARNEAGRGTLVDETEQTETV